MGVMNKGQRYFIENKFDLYQAVYGWIMDYYTTIPDKQLMGAELAVLIFPSNEKANIHGLTQIPGREGIFLHHRDWEYKIIPMSIDGNKLIPPEYILSTIEQSKIDIIGFALRWDGRQVVLELVKGFMNSEPDTWDIPKNFKPVFWDDPDKKVNN